MIPFLVLGFVAILGCGQLTKQVKENLPKASEESSPNFSLAGKEWKTFELDSMDISVELPGQPNDKTPTAAQLPPGTKEVFNAMKIHAYDEKDFGSSYTQLEPTGKRKFQIKELADTSMAALKKQARDLKYSLDIKSDSNAKYDGTFTRNEKAFELKGCLIYQKTKPERVWSVITVYPKDNADGQTASRRIINSVVFKGSSEGCQ